MIKQEIKDEREPETEIDPEVKDMIKDFNVRGFVQALENGSVAQQKAILLRLHRRI